MDQTVQNTLLTAGFACIAAAIVGGGFEAFGIKVPLLGSRGRQAALAGLGAVIALIPAVPYILRTATVSGKIFDITSNQGISGVRISLADKNQNTLAEDIFTTAPDGAFQFVLPRGIKKGQLPLHFQLGRKGWVARYVPDEKIADLSSDQQLNLPVDSSGLTAVVPSTMSKDARSPATASALTPQPANAKAKVGQLTPPSASSEVVEKTVLETGTITVLFRKSPGFLDFEVIVRPTESASLQFDLNKNDKIDPNAYVAYAQDPDPNTVKPCTLYKRGIGTWSYCGEFKSQSTIAVRTGTSDGAPVKIYDWHIPEGEVNAENGDAHFTVTVYNELTKGHTYYPSEDFSQTFRTL